MPTPIDSQHRLPFEGTVPNIPGEALANFNISGPNSESLDGLSSIPEDRFRPNVDFVPTALAHARYKDLGRRATNELINGYFDDLTGLPNEKMFEANLRRGTEMQNTAYGLDAEGQDTNLAVLYIDVDGFKGVNDTLGHTIGDEVIKLVGSALRDGLRPTDTPTRDLSHVENLEIVPLSDSEIKIAEKDGEVSREHGDEFKIIIQKVKPDNPKEDMTDSERINAIKLRLKNSLRKAIELSEHAEELIKLGVDISIGSSVYKVGENPDEVVGRAEQAMKIDKESHNGAR